MSLVGSIASGTYKTMANEATAARQRVAKAFIPEFNAKGVLGAWIKNVREDLKKGQKQNEQNTSVFKRLMGDNAKASKTQQDTLARIEAQLKELNKNITSIGTGPGSSSALNAGPTTGSSLLGLKGLLGGAPGGGGGMPSLLSMIFSKKLLATTVLGGYAISKLSPETREMVATWMGNVTENIIGAAADYVEKNGIETAATHAAMTYLGVSLAATVAKGYAKYLFNKAVISNAVEAAIAKQIPGAASTAASSVSGANVWSGGSPGSATPKVGGVGNFFRRMMGFEQKVNGKPLSEAIQTYRDFGTNGLKKFGYGDEAINTVRNAANATPTSSIASSADDAARSVPKTGAMKGMKFVKGLGWVLTAVELGSAALNYASIDKEQSEGRMSNKEAGQKKGRIVGETAGSIAGGWAGAKGGAAIGASIGTLLGPAGAAVGGILGALIGGGLGAYAGSSLAGSLGSGIGGITAKPDLALSTTPMATPNGAPAAVRQQMMDKVSSRFSKEFGPNQAYAALVNVARESGFNPSAHNPNGEDSWGLFQMNRQGGMGKGYSPEDLINPDKNIEIMISNIKKYAKSDKGYFGQNARAFLNAKSKEEAVTALSNITFGNGNAGQMANIYGMNAQRESELTAGRFGNMPNLNIKSDPTFAFSPTAASAASTMAAAGATADTATMGGQLFDLQKALTELNSIEKTANQVINVFNSNIAAQGGAGDRPFIPNPSAKPSPGRA